MADNTKFVPGIGEVQRRLMVTYVNVSESDGDYKWEAIGVKVEDSSIEFNNELNQMTDILGISHADIINTQPQQSFAPFTIRRDSVLAQKLFDIMIVKKDYTLLKQFEVLIVYGFAADSASGPYLAELQEDCTLEVTSLGGSGTVDMPFNVHYSNKSAFGTVTKMMPASEVKFNANAG